MPADEKQCDDVEQQEAPDHRHVEDKARGDEDQGDLDVAHGDVGKDLADDHLERPHRRGQEIFHRAALAFAGDGERGDDDHGHREHDAHQAGHDVILRDVLRIVLRVDLEVHGPGLALQPGERSGQVVIEHAAGERIHGGERGAGRRRIGGVRLDQHRRALAAEQPVGEIHGDVDDELHVAQLEQALRLGLRRGFPHNDEIVAGAHRLDERAGERPLVGTTQRGRQVARVGVDGEAEHHQLQQRDADHHREGHAVALHLDELLQHHRPEPVKGEPPHASLLFPARPGAGNGSQTEPGARGGRLMRNCPWRRPSG